MLLSYSFLTLLVILELKCNWNRIGLKLSSIRVPWKKQKFRMHRSFVRRSASGWSSPRDMLVYSQDRITKKNTTITKWVLKYLNGLATEDNIKRIKETWTAFWRRTSPPVLRYCQSWVSLNDLRLLESNQVSFWLFAWKICATLSMVEWTVPSPSLDYSAENRAWSIAAAKARMTCNCCLTEKESRKTSRWIPIDLR